MTTTRQAVQRSCWLQKHGTQLLSEFGLIETLSIFGQVQSVGSFSYQLMQVADLDFKIYCAELDRDGILDLAHNLAKRPNVIGTRHLDFTKQPNAPAHGIYLNVYPHFEGELWKMDLLFLPMSAKPAQEDALVTQLQNLTPEQRNTILTIKSQLLEDGLYSNPVVFHTASAIHGVDVYRAVFAGARTADDVVSYKNSGKSSILR